MLTFASIFKDLMLKSASLTQILYWSHVEYSTWPDMSIFGNYTSRAFQRTFSEVYILKTRWNSSAQSFVSKLMFSLTPIMYTRFRTRQNLRSKQLWSTGVDRMYVIWPNKFWEAVSMYLKSFHPKYCGLKRKTHLGD